MDSGRSGRMALAIPMTPLQDKTLFEVVEGFNTTRQEPMANQGRSLTHDQILRITRLLASTDMAINDIAERMGCSRSAIVSVNRRHAIRDYSGQRSRWTVRPDTEDNLGHSANL